jgi:hypothetical protein
MFAKLSVAVAWLAVTGFCESAVAQSAGSALPPGVDAFVASTDALAKSAAERVDLGRAAERLQTIRAALTSKLLAANSKDKLLLDQLNERMLLCAPRLNNIQVAAQRNYIQAVSSKIQEVGKPTQIDNLSAAVAALFASQSITVSVAIPDEAKLKQLTAPMMARCNSDIEDFAEDYYGVKIAPPVQAAGPIEPVAAAIPFVGQLGALLDAITSVVTPVVIAGAQIIDIEARRRAIRRFLADDSNRNAIENDSRKLAAAVSAFVLAKRHKLVGAYSEELAALRKFPIDLSKLDACQELASKKFVGRPTMLTESGGAPKPISGAPSDEFANCWRASWSQIDSMVATVLKEADAYDQIADAGDSENAAKAYQALSKQLESIANGSDGPNLAELWQNATMLIAFANKVNTALSPENRNKVEAAIEALVKGK